MQKLGILFQIDNKMCLYFIHLCVHCREFSNLLLSYYAKYSESAGHNIPQMGDPRKRVDGGKTSWGFYTTKIYTYNQNFLGRLPVLSFLFILE